MGQNPVTGALEPLDLNHLVSCIPEFSMIKTGIETYQWHGHHGIHGLGPVVHA